MSVLWIIGAVLLGLFLLGQLRLGGEVRYGPGEAGVWLRLSGVPIRIYPRKRKKAPVRAPEKEEKGRTEKSKKAEKPAPPWTMERVLELVKRVTPLIGQAAGKLRRHIRVDVFYLDVLLGGGDPGDAAMAFGKLNGCCGIIVPVLEQNFRCRDHRIRTAVDFERENTEVRLTLAISMTLGQLIGFGLWCGYTAWKVWKETTGGLMSNKGPEQKEAVEYGN
ncbi:MAG: DUF2953 domain-containing protein [Clostridiales bacterium]|nr:DUF2953 domain-containing protein [Clostridiales bacterium]